MYFSLQLLHSLALFFFFLVVCENSHCVNLFFSPVHLAFLLLLFCTLYQVNYLFIYASLEVFRVFSLFLHMKDISLSSYFNFVSMKLMKLNETVTYHSLEGILLVWEHPSQSAYAQWLW